MGGRLHTHSNAWVAISDFLTLKWVRSGYEIPFITRPPPLSNLPLPFSLPNNAEKKELLLVELKALVTKQALVRVAPQDLNKPAFYSLLVLVPKVTGGFRPVLDVSRLNKFIECPHFKMETTASIQLAIRPGDWSFSIDLTDAYLHVMMHPKSRKFLRLALSTSEVYEFRVLPFGLNTAPLVFTRLATTVAAALRQRGIRIHVFLDDWLILGQNRALLQSQIPEILTLIKNLGFLVNQKKSRLVLSQRFEYLGIYFDTASQLVRPADHLIAKAILTGSPTSLAETITPRLLMSKIGLFVSIARYVPLGRLFLRPVQFWLRNRWSQLNGDLEDRLVVTSSLSLALVRWTDSEWLHKGTPLLPPSPTITLFTDASTWGWGASLGEINISGIWTPQERLFHINFLEMKAFHNALLELQDHLRSQTLLLLTDNSTVVCYLRKLGGTRSSILCDLTWQIYLLLHALKVDLLVRHIPSKLNVLADALSRPRPLLTEWTLSTIVFRRLQSFLPALSVDMFGP